MNTSAPSPEANREPMGENETYLFDLRE